MNKLNKTLLALGVDISEARKSILGKKGSADIIKKAMSGELRYRVAGRASAAQKKKLESVTNNAIQDQQKFDIILTDSERETGWTKKAAKEGTPILNYEDFLLAISYARKGVIVKLTPELDSSTPETAQVEVGGKVVHSKAYDRVHNLDRAGAKSRRAAATASGAKSSAMKAYPTKPNKFDSLKGTVEEVLGSSKFKEVNSSSVDVGHMVIWNLQGPAVDSKYPTAIATLWVIDDNRLKVKVSTSTRSIENDMKGAFGKSAKVISSWIEDQIKIVIQLRTDAKSSAMKAYPTKPEDKPKSFLRRLADEEVERGAVKAKDAKSNIHPLVNRRDQKYDRKSGLNLFGNKAFREMTDPGSQLEYAVYEAIEGRLFEEWDMREGYSETDAVIINPKGQHIYTVSMARGAQVTIYVQYYSPVDPHLDHLKDTLSKYFPKVVVRDAKDKNSADISTTTGTDITRSLPTMQPYGSSKLGKAVQSLSTEPVPEIKSDLEKKFETLDRRQARREGIDQRGTYEIFGVYKGINSDSLSELASKGEWYQSSDTRNTELVISDSKPTAKALLRASKYKVHLTSEEAVEYFERNAAEVQAPKKDKSDPMHAMLPENALILSSMYDRKGYATYFRLGAGNGRHVDAMLTPRGVRLSWGDPISQLDHQRGKPAYTETLSLEDAAVKLKELLP